MKYIYESPDGGKTIYRRPIGVPNAERELYRSSSGLHHIPPELDISMTIDEDGIVNITI